jgi:hypothetical protein
LITADQKVRQRVTHLFIRAADPVTEYLVELSGIEPPTYGLQSRRSPS